MFGCEVKGSNRPHWTMGRTHKSRFAQQLVDAENVWRDPTTGLRLAPGAIQNWPTRKDEAYLKHLYLSQNKKPDEPPGGVFVYLPKIATQKVPTLSSVA